MTLCNTTETQGFRGPGLRDGRRGTVTGPRDRGEGTTGSHLLRVTPPILSSPTPGGSKSLRPTSVRVGRDSRGRPGTEDGNPVGVALEGFVGRGRPVASTGPRPSELWGGTKTSRDGENPGHRSRGRTPSALPDLPTTSGVVSRSQTERSPPPTQEGGSFRGQDPVVGVCPQGVYQEVLSRPRTQRVRDGFPGSVPSSTQGPPSLG